MTLDMTRGRPFGLLLRFALPLMLSALLQQLYTLCDSMIIGQLLGTEAFAAIGSVSYLHWFPLSMIMGCTLGFGVALSQRFGAKDAPGFRTHFAAGMLLTAFVGATLTVFCGSCVMPLLKMINTPGELLEYSAAYLRVLWLGGMLAIAAFNMLICALRAMGDSRTPFYALILSTLVNIVLDYLFIAVFDMGVEGAALATVAAQVAAAGFCLRALLLIEAFVPRGEEWRPRWPVVREMLRLGVPPLLSNSVIATGELAVLSAINAFGVVFVTGMTASRRYFELLNIVGGGMEGATATFVGQNTGAGEKERVVNGTRVAVMTDLAAAAITGVAVWIFARPLILLFIPHGTPDMIRIGVDSLRVQAVVVVALYMLCTHRAAIQGSGNAIIPMLSGFLELALRLAAAWLMPLLFGSVGLFFTDAVTWTVTALMLIVSYHVIRRRRFS